MTKKLTLSLNEETLQRAERISKRQGKSISEMIEELLNSVHEEEETQETAIDKIKKIVKGKISNPSVQWKEAKAEHLAKKYGI